MKREWVWPLLIAGAAGCTGSGSAEGDTESSTESTTRSSASSSGIVDSTEEGTTSGGEADDRETAEPGTGATSTRSTSSVGSTSAGSTSGAACGAGIDVYEDDSMAICTPDTSTTTRIVECLCTHDPPLMQPTRRPLDAGDLLYYVNRWYSIDPCFPFVPDASVLAEVQEHYINAVDDLEPELARQCGKYQVELVEVPPAFTNDDDQLLAHAWSSPGPEDYTMTLDGEIVGFDAEVGFGPMFAAAAQEGIGLFVQSGFRSLETQAAVFAYYAQLEGDPSLAAVYSAWPAHSEHQLGTTADVGYLLDGEMVSPFDPLEAELHATEAFRWIRANAHRFGIVTTYQPQKVHVHQYKPEPWHLRFVGVEAADLMHTCGLSTEELLAYRYGVDPLPEFMHMDLVYDAVLEGGWAPETCGDE